MAFVPDCLQNFFQPVADIDGDQVRSRGHNFFGGGFAQFENIFYHLDFFLINHAFDAALFDKTENFLLAFLLCLFGIGFLNACEPFDQPVMQVKDR